MLRFIVYKVYIFQFRIYYWIARATVPYLRQCNHECVVNDMKKKIISLHKAYLCVLHIE